jgi:hypothetical protein
LRAEEIPASVRERCTDLLIDIAGLCVAARNRDYILSLKRSLDANGDCTAIGHAETWSPEDAALLNGTAAHGEDFDDTFEGGPVHSGGSSCRQCWRVRALRAAAGKTHCLGIAGGRRTLCRLEPRRAQAHPQRRLSPDRRARSDGGSTCGRESLGATKSKRSDALGSPAAWRAASSIPRRRRLDEGACTPGGLRTADCTRPACGAGFVGPRTVSRARNGLFLRVRARIGAATSKRSTRALRRALHLPPSTFKPSTRPGR